MKKNFLCIFIVLSVFVSCKNKEDTPIDVQDSEFVFGERWALIAEPYVAYRLKPSHTAAVGAHGRQGDIIKVSGTRIDVDDATLERSLWYQFPLGWLSEKSVRIYSNKLKAESAAEKIK